MKKIVALALAAVLALSMSVFVFAADTKTDTGSNNADVDLKVTINEDNDQVDNDDPSNPTPDGKIDPTFSITLTWDNKFEYTYKVDRYDSATHYYVGAFEGAHSTEVKVQNNSNVGITYTASVAAGSETYGTTSAVTNAGAAQKVAAPTPGDSTTPEGSFTVSLNADNGLTTGEAGTYLKVGTVTVVLAQDTSN